MGPRLPSGHVPGNVSGIVRVGQTGNQNSNIQNQRGRRNSALVYGNARSNNDARGENLAANVELVAYGVSKEATSEQLESFVRSKGLVVERIECLTTHIEESRTKTFKVTVKPSEYDKALNPDVWPYRVGVRLFRQKRRQMDLLSGQFSQSGGRVQLQPQQRDVFVANTRTAPANATSAGTPVFVAPQQVQSPGIVTENRFQLLSEPSVN